MCGGQNRQVSGPCAQGGHGTQVPSTGEFLLGDVSAQTSGTRRSHEDRSQSRPQPQVGKIQPSSQALLSATTHLRAFPQLCFMAANAAPSPWVLPFEGECGGEADGEAAQHFQGRPPLSKPTSQSPPPPPATCHTWQSREGIFKN